MMSAGPHVLRFPATLDGMARAADDLRELLAAHHVEPSARYNVELAFDEVVANIVRHAGATEDVHLDVHFARDEIVMRFEDNGTAFDPSGHSDPTLPATLDEASVGGLGLLLLRQMSARVSYERKATHRNVLTVSITPR